MKREDCIYVAGHNGMVGSAVCRKLGQLGYRNVVGRRRDELDLHDKAAVRAFFESARPSFVFLCAAMVGGIGANTRSPADFIFSNLTIQLNVIDSANAVGVKRLLFLGSSCIYPRLAPQPIREESIMSGPLETTNSAYAMAKLAGIEQLNAYRVQFGMASVAVMPTNLYGPHDNFDAWTSHVVPGIMGKMHRAKIAGGDHVMLWGTGTPRRELMHVDDCADACVHLLASPMQFAKSAADCLVNVGTGEDVAILDLATLIAEVVGFEGEIRWDASQPDGTPRKLLDISRLRSMGWYHRAPRTLREGLASTYQWFLEHQE